MDFSLQLYERCAVRGGDGLAFVVHDDANGTAALGAGGGGLGYDGLRRSVAVELDTDYNPGEGAHDGDPAPADHVELRSRGADANDARLAAARLAPVVYRELADGREHLVKIAYAWPSGDGVSGVCPPRRRRRQHF